MVQALPPERTSLSMHGLHTDVHAGELEDRSALVQAVLQDARGWSVDFTVSLLAITSRWGEGVVGAGVAGVGWGRMA